MGFNQNTISYTTYEVLQAPPDWKDAVVEGLRQGRIFTIDIDAGRDKAVGFAVFDDPLNTDFETEHCVFDPLVVFAFRIDKLTVPASTLKLYIRRRVTESLLATRREKMPREERDELAEQVRTELLRRAIPAITAHDVVWDTATGRLRLFSTSAAVCEEFQVRAREFLQLELRAMNTVGVLERYLDERDLHEAYHLLPATFLAPGANGIVRRKEEF